MGDAFRGFHPRLLTVGPFGAYGLPRLYRGPKMDGVMVARGGCHEVQLPIRMRNEING